MPELKPEGLLLHVGLGRTPPRRRPETFQPAENPIAPRRTPRTFRTSRRAASRRPRIESCVAHVPRIGPRGRLIRRPRELYAAEATGWNAINMFFLPRFAMRAGVGVACSGGRRGMEIATEEFSLSLWHFDMVFCCDAKSGGGIYWLRRLLYCSKLLRNDWNGTK